MPVPSPRNKILPARGDYIDLLSNVASILDGEICYAIDQDQYYQNEGGTLVAVGATKAQGTLADSAIQPGDNVSTLTNDANYITSAGAPVQSVAGLTGDVVLVKADVGLNNVDNTSDADKPVSTAQQAIFDVKADLVGGVIPTSQIPAIAITEFLGSVGSEAAMLALTGQPGDWCLRTDKAVGYVIVGADPTLVSNWGSFTVPGSAVTSINSQIGDVVLGHADVGAASAAQGALADSAVQPGDNISDLVNDAGYITAAQVPADAVSSVNTQTGAVVLDADDIDDTSTAHKFATAAQLTDIGTAVQPGDLATVATTGAYSDLSGTPTIPTVPVDSVNTQTGVVVLDADDIDDTSTTHKFATAAQLTDIGTAVQPGDLAAVATSGAYGDLTGTPTIPTVPVDSVNTQTGTVVLDADDIDDTATTHKFATATQLTNADTAVQPGDLATVATSGAYSDLSGTPTIPTVPVDSVNTQTGVVVLDADDIDDSTTAHKFATAAQLTDIGTAVQPGDLATVATSGAYGDLSGTPATAVPATGGTFSGDIEIGTGIDLNADGTVYAASLFDAGLFNPSTDTNASRMQQGIVKIQRSSSTTNTASSFIVYKGTTEVAKITADGALKIGGTLSSSPNISLNANGSAQFAGTVSASGIGVTGNITVSGTVDGRDVAADGALAASAVQPGDLATVATSGAYSDLSGTPTIPTVPVDSVNTQTGVVVLDADDIDDTATTHKFATAAQLSAADSAIQPGDNVSTLTNDASYITLAQVPADAVSSVNSQTGAVVLGASDVGAATTAQGTTADSAIQPGDNISTLTNDSVYITSAGAPVQSVAGKIGAVSLVKGDVGLGNVDNTSDSNKPISTATQTALDSKADLVGGKVPTSQLPALAITEYLGAVASQSAMLALTGERGDWCIRTDLASTFVLVADGGSILGDWQELATPASPVSSVNGQTGAIVLGASDVGAATTAQGSLADSATQPGDNISTLTNDSSFIDAAGAPIQSVNTQTGTVVLTATDVGAATTAQGVLADSSTQPGDNVSTLTNDANYITTAGAPVQSVNTLTGAVVLDAAAVGAATAAQGTTADTATQPGDNVSTLTNDANYITAAQAPVQTVNGGTGAVVITAASLNAATSAQGALADTAVQPNDDITTLNNNAGYIADAPSDGNQYARQDAGWSVVTGGGTTEYNGLSAWGLSNGAGDLLNGMNVSGVTRTSGGNYTVNFATPMPSANYSAVASSSIAECKVKNLSTTSFDITTSGSAGSVGDSDFQFQVAALNALPPAGGTGVDAWASTSGSATLLHSFNIASVTKSGTTGRYVYTFTTPMPDANYAVQATSNSTSQQKVGAYAYNKLATGFSVQTFIGASGIDAAHAVSVNATNATLPATVTQEQIEAAINNPGLSAWGMIENGVLLSGLNIASYTKKSDGLFDVVFITPMPSANYSVVASASNRVMAVEINSQTANGFTLESKNRGTGALQDPGGAGFPVSFQVAATNALPPKGTTGTDAWGQVSPDGTLDSSFNCTVSNTVKPDGTTVAAATGIRYVTFNTPMPTSLYAVTASNAGLTGGGNWDVTAADKQPEGFTFYIRAGAGDYTDQGFDFTVNATNATLPATLTKQQVASAYGRVSSSNVLTGGFNIASTSYPAGTLSVTFATPMANNDYTVVANFDTSRNGAGSDAVWLTTTNQTTTGFDIVVRTMSVDTRTSVATQAVVLRNNDTVGVSFAVFGGN